MRMLRMTLALCGVLILATGCTQTSDDIQREQQEKLLMEGTNQVGMPAIKNFRMKKIMKDIQELCDQEGLVTYTYLENLQPQVVPGKTSLGGKLTFLGETISYPIPCATQFTNPMKVDGNSSRYLTLPQADPSGLFSPASAEGSWLLMLDPVRKKAMPVYTEPRVVTMTFKLPFD